MAVMLTSRKTHHGLQHQRRTHDRASQGLERVATVGLDSDVGAQTSFWLERLPYTWIDGAVQPMQCQLSQSRQNSSRAR